MNEIDVYVGITGQKDEWDSGGSITGVFLVQSQAEEHVQGRGWYGGVGEWEKRKAISYDGNMYLLDKDIDFAMPANLEARRNLLDPIYKEKKRESVIKKIRRILTKDELDALNL